MSQTIDQVWRDYKTDKVPASGDHWPDKKEIRALLKMIQNSGGQAVTRNTLSALNGVTPPNENYMGVVLTGAEAGYYSRSGGAWVFGRRFPDSVARLVSVEGTNVISAGVDAGVSPTAVSMYVLTPVVTNTSSVSLNISGGGAKPLLNVNGRALNRGEIQAGSPVLIHDDGAGNYRIVGAPSVSVARLQAVAGTPNAITANTDGVDTAAVVLFSLTPTATNTGTVTIALNGTPARPLRAFDGGELDAGFIQSGKPVLLYNNGDGTYRLLVDHRFQTLSDITLDAREEALFQANRSEEEADRSEIEADRSEAAAIVSSGAMSAVVLAENTFATKTTAEAFSPAAAPDYIRTAGYNSAGDGGGALYRKVDNEPGHAGKLSITLADGEAVAWYELADDQPRVTQFGAVDGADSQTALVGAVGCAYLKGSELYWPDGEYTSTASIPNFHDVKHFGGGAVKRGTDVFYVDPSRRTNETLTYNVPTFFPDLQTAWDYLSRYKPGAQVVADVVLEAGYVIEKGFRVDDADLSWCQISSTDTIVPVSPDFEHVSISEIDAGPTRSSLYSFVGLRSRMPRWNILVDHAAAETVAGYLIVLGSTGVIRNHKGVINADYTVGGGTGSGIRADSNSFLSAPYAIADGCGVGFETTKTSTSDIQFSSAQGCRYIGIDVSRGSTCYAWDATVEGAEIGVYVRRSRCVIQLAEIKNCAYGIQALMRSDVTATDASFLGSGFVSNIGSGSIVDLTGATKNGSPLTSADIPSSYFNALNGRGIITDAGRALGHGRALNADTAISNIAAGSQSVAPLSYHTIVDIAGTRQFAGGAVYGANVGLRITIDGVEVLNDNTQAPGQNGDSDNVAVVAVPSLTSMSSIKIEVMNRDSSVSRVIGWKVYRIL